MNVDSINVEEEAQKLYRGDLGVAILNAQEGDILVISCSRPITNETAEWLVKSVEQQFPKLKAIVLSDGLKVDGVIRGV